MTAFDKAWNLVKEKIESIDARDAGTDDYEAGVPFDEGVKPYLHDSALSVAYLGGYKNAMKEAVEMGYVGYGDEKTPSLSGVKRPPPPEGRLR